MSKPSTLAEAVKLRLEKEIFEGKYRPGDRLTEDVISRRCGASRTPVREAFKLLAASGLVEIKPHQGAIVRQLKIGDLIEMFQVMAELEGLSARLAAKKINTPQKAQLRAIHEKCIRLVKQDDFEGFYEANIVFHEIIYQSSGNKYLHKEMQSLRMRLAPYRRQITYYPGRMQASIGEHEAVLEAILNGDGERADKAMREHVNILGDSFTEYLSIFAGDTPATYPATASSPSSTKQVHKRARNPLLNRATQP